MECVGARISGGGHVGPMRQGARPGGWGALDPRGQVLAPPDVFSVPKIRKYSRKKSYFIFGAFGELLFLGYFFYCMDNSENRRKILFLLYLI